MSRRAKVHYNRELPSYPVVETGEHRVARYCGAITTMSTPQVYVHETRHEDRVTCLNCLNRMDREYFMPPYAGQRL